MTPEERYQRIDETLERVGKRLDELAVRQHELAARQGELAARQDKFEIEMEVQRHDANLRLKKLEEMQIVLMDSQNSTWAAVNQLTANIERFMHGSGANGHGE